MASETQKALTRDSIAPWLHSKLLLSTQYFSDLDMKNSIRIESAGRSVPDRGGQLLVNTRSALRYPTSGP
jgi:hypothetical protein